MIWRCLSGDRVVTTNYSIIIEVVSAILLICIGVVLFFHGTSIVVSSAQSALVLWAKEENHSLVDEETKIKSEAIPLARGGSEHFVFTDSWRPLDKEAYIIDGEFMSIKPSHERAVFAYSQPVPKLQDFHFSFATGELGGANLSFGRSEFYELVIGDNDDKTLSLKARQRIGGEWVAVPEYNWETSWPTNNPNRPFLVNCKIAPGEENSVTVEEKYLEEIGKIKISVTVSCRNRESDSLMFQFTPVPNWERRTSVYLGLVNSFQNEGNPPKIYFLEPDVLTFLK